MARKPRIKELEQPPAKVNIQAMNAPPPPPIGHDIAEQFMQQLNTTETVQVLKELFDQSKIRMITELDHDEIAILTRIIGIAKVKNLKEWEEIADVYAMFMVSHRRKSRHEVVDAIKGMLQRKFNLLQPNTWGGRNQGRY